MKPKICAPSVSLEKEDLWSVTETRPEKWRKVQIYLEEKNLMISLSPRLVLWNAIFFLVIFRELWYCPSWALKIMWGQMTTPSSQQENSPMSTPGANNY